ncbi:hypothetical protein B0J11DRAFT_335285 [Dendryphion nanum]|uniref:Uncharacterized protein n=1 Tax=Dendryphion nanum TaxID=256645 RepID=A0A9P9DN50_9PLEO|nr:hypothetical protein B0J11DRAFT_335285 [Dendryphion nanum]
MPAIHKRKQSIVRNLSRRHELAVAEKFGVWPVTEAIPSSCRPKTATLSCSLLAKLADLALRTTSLKDFQRHLLRAWKFRLTDNLPPAKELGLQLSDVVIALHHLEKAESAEAARPETPRILRRASVAKPHHPINSSPGVPEPQESPAHRPELRRSSKSAAGAKINAWASTIKRPRKASNSVSNTANPDTMLDNSEDEAPTPRGVKRAKTTASPRPTSTLLPTPQLSPRLATKRPSRISRTRANSQHSSQPGSAYVPPSPGLPESVDSSGPVRRLRRGLSGDLSRQEEHAFFFKMPKGQHYKKVDPVMIDDIMGITDFDSLPYPVEVKGNKRGEYYEVANADELRAMVETRKHSSPDDSSRSTEASASPAPSVHQLPKQQEPSRAPTPFIPTLSKPVELSVSLLPSPEPSPIAMTTPAPLSVAVQSPIPQESKTPGSPTTLPESSESMYKSLVDSFFKDFPRTMLAANTSILRSQDGQALSPQKQAQISALSVNFLTDVQSVRKKYEVGIEELLFPQDEGASVQNQSTCTTMTETEEQREDEASDIMHQNSTPTGFKAPYGLAILS